MVEALLKINKQWVQNKRGGWNIEKKKQKTKKKTQKNTQKCCEFPIYEVSGPVNNRSL